MMTTLPVLPKSSDRVRGCCLPLASRLAEEQVVLLNTLFKALADPVRLQILHMLKAATEPVCVCDLTAALDVGQPTVSHHLSLLKAAGLITSRKRGIWAYYALRTDLAPTTRAVLDRIP